MLVGRSEKSGPLERCKREIFLALIATPSSGLPNSLGSWTVGRCSTRIIVRLVSTWV